jgi:parallel beta-helix repeat protein
MKKFSLIFVFLLFLLFLIGNSQALDEKILSEEKINVRELGEVLKIEEKLELSPVISENVDEEIFEELEEKEFVRIVVKLKDGDFDFSSIDKLINDVSESKENILSEIEKNEISLIYDYETLNAFAAEVNWEGLEYLMNNEEVEFIYAERILELTLDESVPLINADDVWEIEGIESNITGFGEVVCVIDSGIDYTHPDLGGCLGENCKVIDGIDFRNGDFDPMDDNFHGTHVAGIVAANGVKRGVAPDSKLLAAKVCGETGSCSNIDIIAGTDWCINNLLYNNVSVLTMSIGNGGEYNETTCPTWMDFAIDTAYNLDLPFSIASGNEGHKNGISYPACSQNAISVGATYDENVGSQSWSSCTDEETSEDMVACFSNSYGGLDLMAPGAMITSTVLDGEYSTAAGTSMATPHVAGTIALVNQFYSGSSLGVEQITNLLKLSGNEVIDEGNGVAFSRIDSLGATNSTELCIIPEDEMIFEEDSFICPGTYELPSGIVVGSNNVVLDCQGAKFIGSWKEGTGIKVYYSDEVLIKNCKVENYASGIELDHSKEVDVHSNFLKHNNYGFYINDNDGEYTNNKIYKNEISSNNYGGVIKRSSRNSVAYNDFSNNSYGLEIKSTASSQHSDENVVYENVFADNEISSVFLSGYSNDNNVWGNEMWAVGISYTNTNNEYCEEGVGNDYYDGASGPSCECMPLLDDLTINSNDDICFDNQIYHLPNGLNIGKDYMALDCNGSSIIGNGKNNGVGIEIDTFEHFTLKNCKINNYEVCTHLRFGNSYQGGAWYTSIENNSFSFCDRGIGTTVYDVASAHSEISNNKFFDNNRGFSSYNIGSHTLYSNNFTDNGVGISISGSSSSTHIYDNYLDNSVNVATTFGGAGIYWNESLDCNNQTNIIGGDCLGGNYWNNYFGSDLNGDGIGDTEVPHNSSGEIINSVGDLLPLVINSTEEQCSADINNDEIVNTNDLLIVISDWGSSNSSADINEDGTVNTNDLLMVVDSWGEC